MPSWPARLDALMASGRRSLTKPGGEVAAALRVIAACVCLAVVPAQAEDPGPEIIVKQAGRECFTDLIHASGYIVPRASALVMFPMPGYRITDVRAKGGDMVKRGDVLARAVPVGPPKNPPADKPGVAADVPLQAPASGIILQNNAFEGMPTSQASKPLFTLAVDGVTEAAVDVPSVHILELHVGQVAHLNMRDGSVLDGRVRRMPAIVDSASQMGATRLSIDVPQGLEPSRFVRATIEARRACGIGVSSAALRRTSVGASVQVVDNGVITIRAVTLGLANETDTEVISGVAEGDLVVAGTGVSREGDRVTPIFADPQDER